MGGIGKPPPTSVERAYQARIRFSPGYWVDKINESPPSSLSLGARTITNV
ncbi:hypothetical protein VTO73DRAFT_3901 [Trametes versicolor]